MNRSFFFSVLVMGLAGCGGNWSNADLVFANALPRTDDLKSNLPAESTSQPLEGVATRRDGLMLGDPSVSWSLTKGAAKDFNNALLTLLSVVDTVRKIPPTSRTTNSRTWGPSNDSNNPGRELQVVIERIDEKNFAWRVQSRPLNGEWINLLEGNFLANGETSARTGQGSIRIPVKDFRDVVKTDINFSALDEVRVAYITDSWPKRVDMDFDLKPGATTGLSALGYTAMLREDGSGTMRFLFAQNKPEAEQIRDHHGLETDGRRPRLRHRAQGNLRRRERDRVLGPRLHHLVLRRVLARRHGARSRRRLRGARRVLTLWEDARMTRALELCALLAVGAVVQGCSSAPTGAPGVASCSGGGCACAPDAGCACNTGSCMQSCGSECTFSCNSSASCSVNSGAKTTVACNNGADCTATLGDQSTFACNSSANCNVTVGADTTVACNSGTCTLQVVSGTVACNGNGASKCDVNCSSSCRVVCNGGTCSCSGTGCQLTCNTGTSMTCPNGKQTCSGC
ncbi:MAG: hypothetical protein QM817_13430 [Archangium sp.]